MAWISQSGIICMPDSSWAATMAQGLIPWDHKARQHPSLTTERASQPRGQHLGSVESSARVAAGCGHEVGRGGVSVCALMFSLHNIGRFSICLLKRFGGCPRQPNRRTLVCEEFHGTRSLQQVVRFPSA